MSDAIRPDDLIEELDSPNHLYRFERDVILEYIQSLESQLKEAQSNGKEFVRLSDIHEAKWQKYANDFQPVLEAARRLMKHNYDPNKPAEEQEIEEGYLNLDLWNALTSFDKDKS